MTDIRPRVGILFNPTSPALLNYAPDLVEHLAVMPDRMWYDFGASAKAARFRPMPEALTEVAGFAQGRSLVGHGLGLSLPSAMPLDRAMVAAVGGIAHALGGFRWYSEHLNVFVTPKGGVPNAQAGLGMPVIYDEETYTLVAAKLRVVGEHLGMRVLLENGSFFTPVGDQDMTEPEFLNRLYREGHGGTLLDLHNLIVTERNDGISAEDYLAALDPLSVEEVHLAGGDDEEGFYMDSHSTLTPQVVWDLARDYLPRCRNLKAITFEYQESYFLDLGLSGLTGELERMHDLAWACTRQAEVANAG